MDTDRLEEQRRRLTESAYLRLFENIWTAAEDSLANWDDLRACVLLDGPGHYNPEYRYVIGVDVGLKHDRTAVAVCHRETVRSPIQASPNPFEIVPWTQPKQPSRKAKFALDRMNVWQGSRLKPVRLETVGEWIQEAARYYRAKVVFDPFQAMEMTQRLREKGVVCEEFTFSSQSVGKLAATLHQVIRDQALALPDDEELLAELANVKLRETSPGVLRMDHVHGQHDDRAIAISLAINQLMKAPPQRATVGKMRDMRYSTRPR